MNAAARQVHVQSLVRRAQERLFLQAHQVEVRIMPKQPKDEETGELDPHVLACVNTNTPYLVCSIEVYPAFFDVSPDRQAHAIMHELAHLLTQPLRVACVNFLNGKMMTWEDVRDRNERLVDWIARIATASTPAP